MDKNAKALSVKDAIQLYPALGCAGHLANLRNQRRGPKFYKTGKKVVYKPQDIEAFLFKTPIQTYE